MLSNRDVQLKKERGYHGKSYVRPDGSEVLLDKFDWLMRRRELEKRSGGRCENVNNEGFRCISPATIPSHVIPRHPRRDDRMENLKHQCNFHDKVTEIQAWRVTRFGEKGKPCVKRKHNAYTKRFSEIRRTGYKIEKRWNHKGYWEYRLGGKA